ncbi:hypothetical protein [Tetragenococcus halophilus]|uniref:Phage protein n=2 Tax=Tetragenococcus TaxID=51668 RepID=A0AB35HQV3_TETHA|nr:hypothetical protein [Tetragenococcus halophilus]MCO8298639.1 hypothetical protein [Tetragenococcus halophilus]
MKDMLMTIYNQLLTNEYIRDMTQIDSSQDYRIKFYEYPENGDRSGAFITIRPMQPISEAYHASNKEMSVSFWYQIDVECRYRMTAKEIQYQIKKEMKKLGFGQSSDGLDEYFSETKHYVDARRYTGNSKIYDTAY